MIVVDWTCYQGSRKPTTYFLVHLLVLVLVEHVQLYGI